MKQKEIEDAAKRYADNSFSKEDEYDTAVNDFQAGAKWAIKELMKYGHEVVVDDLDWHFYHYCLGVLNLTKNDKVKIVVIKDGEYV